MTERCRFCFQDLDVKELVKTCVCTDLTCKECIQESLRIGCVSVKCKVCQTDLIYMRKAIDKIKTLNNNGGKTMAFYKAIECAGEPICTEFQGNLTIIVLLGMCIISLFLLPLSWMMCQLGIFKLWAMDTFFLLRLLTFVFSKSKAVGTKKVQKSSRMFSDVTIQCICFAGTGEVVSVIYSIVLFLKYNQIASEQLVSAIMNRDDVSMEDKITHTYLLLNGYGKMCKWVEGKNYVVFSMSIFMYSILNLMYMGIVNSL